MSVEPIPTPSAPPVAGPYSPAVRAGNWITLAGQVGIDPATGALASGGLEAETRQALANVKAVLTDCGTAWNDVARVTIYLAGDLEHFGTVNAIYETVLGGHRPARTTVAVAALPLHAAVEIEVWAYQERPS